MTVGSISINSPAKLNLTFDIVGSLPNGYHEVATLMQSIDLADELIFSIEPAEKLSVHIQANRCGSDFPCDDSNLIAKAARAYFEKRSDLDPFKMTVSVNKQIPIAAGLAGGSGNAAAALLALNRHFGNLSSDVELVELAKSLGADVPFCLIGGLSIGRGRGDILEPVDSAESMYFCLLKPRDIALSTPWVYQQYDAYINEIGQVKRPNLESAVGALSFGDLDSAIQAFGNVFEPVVYSRYPQLHALKEKLTEFGCPYAQLTGSGPTIFGLTSDWEMAHFVRSKCIAEFDVDKVAVFIGQSTKHGCRIANGESNG